MKKVIDYLKILFLSFCINLLFGLDDELIYAPMLEVGDTIAFCAPASYLDKDRMSLAKQRIEKRGYEVIISDSLFRRYGYLAGSDKQRASELMNFFIDPKIKAIFPGTGGYGSTRILEYLDFKIIRENPKIFIGFSDITAIHIAINQLSGLVTFHTPNPMYGLGSSSGLDTVAGNYFWKFLETRQINKIPFDFSTDSEKTVVLKHGIAKGRLVGGNLSLICSTMGSDFEIKTSNKILFIEDVGEAPYRIDRYLQELKLGRKLDSLSGVIIGRFERRKHEPLDKPGDFKMEQVLDQYFIKLDIPVIKNFSAGHIKRNISLPMGAMIEINTKMREIKILQTPESGIDRNF